MIAAHDNPLAALAFNSTGTKIATASEKVEIDFLLCFHLNCVHDITFGERHPHFSFTEIISLSLGSAAPSKMRFNLAISGRFHSEIFFFILWFRITLPGSKIRFMN